MNELPMINEWHEWPASKKWWMTWMTYQWERINVMNDLPIRKVEWHEWPTNEKGWMKNDLPMKKDEWHEWPTNEKGWMTYHEKWMTWITFQWERINAMNDLPIREDENNLSTMVTSLQGDS